MCEIKSISVNTIACVPSEIDMHKFIHEKKYNEQRYGAPACAVECIINGLRNPSVNRKFSVRLRLYTFTVRLLLTYA